LELEEIKEKAVAIIESSISHPIQFREKDKFNRLII
jgi:hypothetical protein